MFSSDICCDICNEIARKVASLLLPVDWVAKTICIECKITMKFCPNCKWEIEGEIKKHKLLEHRQVEI
jgi:hypothetical protein